LLFGGFEGVTHIAMTVGEVAVVVEISPEEVEVLRIGLGELPVSRGSLTSRKKAASSGYSGKSQA
jgi:hypothetical protein